MFISVFTESKLQLSLAHNTNCAVIILYFLYSVIFLKTNIVRVIVWPPKADASFPSERPRRERNEASAFGS